MGLGIMGLGVTGLGVMGLGVMGLGVTGLGVMGLGVMGLGVTGPGVMGLGVMGLYVGRQSNIVGHLMPRDFMPKHLKKRAAKQSIHLWANVFVLFKINSSCSNRLYNYNVK